MDISPSRKRKITPYSRNQKEIILVSNTPSRKAILQKPITKTRQATKQQGTRPGTKQQGTRKRKVEFDDDGIQYLETPKKRPTYPNKSKTRTASIGKEIMPKNENHGPLELNVIKKIGSGSYGDVFQVQIQNLDNMPDNFPPSNNYALKKMLDPKLNRAFEYEQKIMNEIQKKYPKCSPHVLCYFDIAIDKNGLYYLLSEMQEGDVKDIYKNTPSKEERLKIGTELLRQSLLGLEELKKVGLLHRDIKMDNILYSTEKKSGNIKFKLADFGLSCSETNPDIKCGTGVFGTPAYISPKVLLLNFSGKAKDMEDLWDETDDVYSLAAVMYEFIFGEELMNTEAFALFSEMFESKDGAVNKIDQFTEILEKQFQNASERIRQEMKLWNPSSKEYKLYNFIFKNINPFEKKQTIRQSIKSI
jgi:serine/threonine protein kinase